MLATAAAPLPTGLHGAAAGCQWRCGALMPLGVACSPAAASWRCRPPCKPQQTGAGTCHASSAAGTAHPHIQPQALPCTPRQATATTQPRSAWRCAIACCMPGPHSEEHGARRQGDWLAPIYGVCHAHPKQHCTPWQAEHDRSKPIPLLPCSTAHLSSASSRRACSLAGHSLTCRFSCAALSLHRCTVERFVEIHQTEGPPSFARSSLGARSCRQAANQPSGQGWASGRAGTCDASSWAKHEHVLQNRPDCTCNCDTCICERTVMPLTCTKLCSAAMVSSPVFR